MMRSDEVKEALSKGDEPQKWARKIMEDVGGDPSALEALLDGLVRDPSPQVAGVLQRLLSLAQQKEVKKVIKRALFKLRQRGVQLEFPSGGRPALRPIKPPEPKGYLGAMDGRGRRFVVVERQGARTAVVGYIALGSVEEGLLDFFRLETTRKGWRDLLQGQVVSPAFPLVEAPAGYCWTLIRELADGASAKGALPPDYDLALRELADLRWDGPIPLIYQFISKEEVLERPSLLKASEGLFEVSPFSLWFLDPDEVKPYAEELKRAEESPLALTDAQKAERREGIISKALEELFPEERRLSFKRRLEEMAYILWKRGDRDRAKAALAAALELERPLSSFAPHPFLRALLLRSMAGAMEGEAKEPSLLITP